MARLTARPAILISSGTWLTHGFTSAKAFPLLGPHFSHPQASSTRGKRKESEHLLGIYAEAQGGGLCHCPQSSIWEQGPPDSNSAGSGSEFTCPSCFFFRVPWKKSLESFLFLFFFFFFFFLMKAIPFNLWATREAPKWKPYPLKLKLKETRDPQEVTCEAEAPGRPFPTSDALFTFS